MIAIFATVHAVSSQLQSLFTEYRTRVRSSRSVERSALPLVKIHFLKESAVSTTPRRLRGAVMWSVRSGRSRAGKHLSHESCDAGGASPVQSADARGIL
eukprot:5598934-Prymnesium_polylepis.1